MKKQRIKWKELIPAIVEVATKKMSLKDEVVRIMCQKEHVYVCNALTVVQMQFTSRMCCSKVHDIDRHICHAPKWWNGYTFIPVTVKKSCIE